MANQFFGISNVTGLMVADIFLMMLLSLGYDYEGDKMTDPPYILCALCVLCG